MVAFSAPRDCWPTATGAPAPRIATCAPRAGRARTGGRWLAVVFLATATGCAGWSARHLPKGSEPINLVLMPVELSLHVRHLVEIATPPAGGLAKAAERAQVKETLAAVGETLHRDLLVRLDAAPGLTLVEEAAASRAAAMVGPWPDAASQRVAAARAAGAGAVMEVELLGYGRVPRRWLAYLIGSGVAEGVVQGVIAAQVVHNFWVALAVAAEEVTSETLTWGGGAFLFNAYYAPVTVRATLYDGHTVFVPVDRKRLRHLPETERHRREPQLALTLDAAEARLIDTLAEVVAARPAE